jgi:hypothetical protein
MKGKLVPRKLDKSTDYKLTSKDSMIEAINVRAYDYDDGAESTGSAGVLKNPKSNMYVEGFDDLPFISKFKILGSVTDNKAKIVYFFVWNEVKSQHMVMAYDKYGRLPYIDGNGDVLFQLNSQHIIYSTTLLNFPEDAFVKGDIVHINNSSFDRNEQIKQQLKQKGIWNDMRSDAILYFTDNNGEPKKLNVYRAIVDGYTEVINTPAAEQEARDFISACPRTPLDRIVPVFGYDPSVNISNFVNTRGFQFAYQWVYKDGFESAISVYSDIAVPKRRLNQGALTNIDDEYNNVITLNVPTGTDEVEYIKILAREGDTGSFLEVDKVRRNESETYNGVQVWDSTNALYRFYNNKVVKAVSTEVVNKQFDDLPRVAQAQAVSNNRLFYGNYVNGFDNVEVRATITPVYNEYPSGEDIGVTIEPRVRASIDKFANTTVFGIATETKKYPAGATYMLDFSGVQSIEPDSTIRVFMKISPDQNFHVFRNNGVMPALNHQTAEGYASGESQFTNQLGDVVRPLEPTQLNSPQQNRAGINLNYRTYTPEGSVENKNVLMGSNSSAPMIVKTYPLVFEVEFTWRGDVVTTGADLLLADLITFFISQEPFLITDQINEGLSFSDPEAWDLSDLSYDYSWNDVIEQITVKKRSNVKYDLELNHLDTITCGAPSLGVNADGSNFNGYGSADQNSKLIFPLLDASDRLGIPAGYGILNKFDGDFKIDYVNKSNNGKVREFMIQIDSISDMNVFTCCSRPDENKWYVLDPQSMILTGGATVDGKITQFLSQTNSNLSYGLNGFFGYYPANIPVQGAFNIDEYGFEIEEIKQIQGQFGFVSSTINSTIFLSDSSDQLANKYWELIDGQFENALNELSGAYIGAWCVYDGESGIGGKGIDSTPYSVYNFSLGGSILKINIWLNNSDLDFDNNVNPSEWDTHIRCLGGMYFNGCDWRLKIRPAETAPVDVAYIKNYPSYMPLLTSSIDFEAIMAEMQSQPQPLHEEYLNNNQFYHPDQLDQYNIALTRPQIEGLSLFVDAFGLDTGTDYKSFKSDSYHDFGIVYYDERGRHGFVNHAGNVYVAGYSDAERGENKGSVFMKFDINSEPPEWATRWKVVHSKSTTTDYFIQYSSGGAFVRPDSTDDTNIYVSLNYLQYSQVSYASAFGARDPEGGILLYNFQPGDKLRVLSYETSGTTREYPKNYEFDIVDAKFLEDGDNPLHDGNETPPFNKTGQFLILKNNTDATNFNHSSVSEGADLWGNNCIIEVYRPIKDRETIIYREIGPTFGINRNTDTPEAKHGTPLIVKDGDVWFRRMAVNMRDYIGGEYVDIIVDDTLDSGVNASQSKFRSMFLESQTFSDLIKGDSIGHGRPNVILDDAGEVRNEDSITYSDATASSSKTVRYSSFNNALLNFKDLDKSYGDIRFLIDRGDHLLVILEDKCMKIPVGRKILSTASGNNLITSSTDILGDEVFFNGNAGCGDHPESVVQANESVYFAHNGIGKVFRIDNNAGVTDITDLGVSHYVRDLLTADIANNSYRKVISGFDNFNDEYILTIKDQTYITSADPAGLDTVISYGCGDGLINNFECDGQLQYNAGTVDSSGGQDQTDITDEEGTDSVDEGDGGETVDTNVYGCMDGNACNFNDAATVDDGSCVYPQPGYDCDGNQTIVSNYGPNEGDKKLADYVAANGLTLANLKQIDIHNPDIMKNAFNAWDLNDDGSANSQDLLQFLAMYQDGSQTVVNPNEVILPPQIQNPGEDYNVVNHPNITSDFEIVHVLAWTQEDTNDLNEVIEAANQYLKNNLQQGFLNPLLLKVVLVSIQSPGIGFSLEEGWDGYGTADLLFFLSNFGEPNFVYPIDNSEVIIPV